MQHVEANKIMILASKIVYISEMIEFSTYIYY